MLKVAAYTHNSSPGYVNVTYSDQTLEVSSSYFVEVRTTDPAEVIQTTKTLVRKHESALAALEFFYQAVDVMKASPFSGDPEFVYSQNF